MNYEYLNMGAYNLHIIHTNKFKTITVEVDFRRKVNKDEITKRNLLKSILLYSTKEYPDERKLISFNMRIGNYANLSFRAKFLNEKYTSKELNKESINFLMDVLFNPDIEEKSFNEAYLTKCKNKLERSIKSLKDNKLKYTLFKLLETTEDKPYSYNSYGYIEDLKKINGKNLYEYYKQVINNDMIDIFVVGEVDTIKVKEIFKEYFKTNTFKKNINEVTVKELEINKKVKFYEEIDEVNQTQLTLLCNLKSITDFERKYTLPVYSEMLGGSSNSLLFDTVREKNSYAYYINSNAKSYDNILMIYSGIENGNDKEVYKLIKKVLQNVSKGNFTKENLEDAKSTLISAINASKDSQAGIINTYYASVLVGAKDFEERIENINKITKENIIDLAKKVHIHTVYTLKGENTNEED